MSAPDPSMSVRLDTGWVELPVREDGDPGDWAAATVARLLSDRGRSEPSAIEQLYVQSYALAVERLQARRDDDELRYLAGAYALLGADEADLLPLTVAELWATGSPLGVDATVDALVAESDDRFGEPLLGQVVSPAGTAVRLQQYRVLEDPAGSVETSLVYVWPGPLDGTIVMITAWFHSVVDGELCQSTMDELAESLTYVPA